MNTRNSCAQLGAPTGSVPNINHHIIALQLARCAHIRFDLCARIEIFLSCLQVAGSGSTTCRCFHQKYPRFFLRFDRFPERIYNARAVRGGTDLHPVHRTASEISIYIYRQDMPESLHGPDRQTLRKCPVGAIIEFLTECASETFVFIITGGILCGPRCRAASIFILEEIWIFKIPADILKLLEHSIQPRDVWGSPEIILEMLDVKKNPRKPVYKPVSSVIVQK